MAKMQTEVRTTSYGPYARHHQLKCVDATKDRVIHMNKHDISQGVCDSATKCAFAQALGRVSDVVAAVVLRTTAHLHMKNGTLVRYMLSPAMRHLVEAGDAKEDMRPGTYTLLAPTGWATRKAIHKRARTRVRKDKNNGALRIRRPARILTYTIL